MNSPPVIINRILKLKNREDFQCNYNIFLLRFMQISDRRNTGGNQIALEETHSLSTKKKKIAALISEYRLRSHADVIIGRMLGGYYYQGQHHEPRVEVISMYTDQVPDMDMSRDLVAKHEFKIYPSIRQALTLISDHS